MGPDRGRLQVAGCPAVARIQAALLEPSPNPATEVAVNGLQADQRQVSQVRPRQPIVTARRAIGPRRGALHPERMMSGGAPKGTLVAAWLLRRHRGHLRPGRARAGDELLLTGAIRAACRAARGGRWRPVGGGRQRRGDDGCRPPVPSCG